MSLDRSTATTGIEELDRALGGLYWGDNVVLDAESKAAVEPFYRAATEAGLYDTITFVTLAREPEELEASFPGVAVLDARASTPIAQARPLLESVARICAKPGRHLVLFDSLEAMSDRWGREAAGVFFSRGCPLLLGLGAIAYWSLTAARHSPVLRREIEGITQCVLVLGDDTLRIAKAEGRPPGVEGSVFRYRLGDDGLPALEAASTAARLGAALRALRSSRRLSQGELATACRGLVERHLAGRARTPWSLARHAARSHREAQHLSRRAAARRGGAGIPPGPTRRPAPRREQPTGGAPRRPEAGLRAYLVRLSPGGTAAPEFVHKGVELVTVATGLVQVQLATGRPVLRPGEALIADQSGVEGWRNLTDREAVAFWILHDEPRYVAQLHG